MQPGLGKESDAQPEPSAGSFRIGSHHRPEGQAIL